MLEWCEKQQENLVVLSDAEKETIEHRIWSAIRRKTVKPILGLKLMLWQKISLAASVLLILTISFLFLQNTTEKAALVFQKNTINEGVVVKNTTQKPQKIRLEDGSTIQLSANSSISYPEHFGDKKRSVFLKGEAFFEVKKDPTKPFVVHAGNLTTEVLGTSFRIKSYEEAQTIEVSVKTGRVSVFEDDKNDDSKTRKGMILTPNQKVIFNKQTKEIIPTIVAQPIPIVQIESAETFIFEEVTIDQVLAKLRRIYGLEILVENQALNHCVFTGDLNDLPLDTQLDLICRSINARYEQRGMSIFINGEGCR